MGNTKSILLSLICCFASVAIWSQELPSNPYKKTWEPEIPQLPANVQHVLRSRQIDGVFDSANTTKFQYREGIISQVDIEFNLYTSQSRITHYYDNKGRILKTHRKGKGDLYEWIIYEYNDSALTSTELCFNKDSTLILTTFVKYNKNLAVVEIVITNKDGDLAGQTLFRYNSQNDLVHKITINSIHGGGMEMDGKFTPWPNDTVSYEYSYNENLRIKKKYDSGKLISVSSNYKNSDTLIIKTESYWKTGELNSITIEKAVGDVIITERYSPDRLQSTLTENVTDGSHEYKVLRDGKIRNLYTYHTKYEYDKHGNWISKTEFENNIPMETTVRRIKYND